MSCIGKQNQRAVATCTLTSIVLSGTLGVALRCKAPWPISCGLASGMALSFLPFFLKPAQGGLSLVYYLPEVGKSASLNTSAQGSGAGVSPLTCTDATLHIIHSNGASQSYRRRPGLDTTLSSPFCVPIDSSPSLNSENSTFSSHLLASVDEHESIVDRKAGVDLTGREDELSERPANNTDYSYHYSAVSDYIGLENAKSPEYLQHNHEGTPLFDTCPFFPVVPSLALSCNAGLMAQLPVAAWIRLVIVTMGVFIRPELSKYLQSPSRGHLRASP